MKIQYILILFSNNSFLGDVCVSKKGLRQSIKILHRYHFSSALKRMSVISSVQSASDAAGTNNHIVATKGAPETLRKMVNIIFYLFIFSCFKTKVILKRIH